MFETVRVGDAVRVLSFYLEPISMNSVLVMLRESFFALGHLLIFCKSTFRQYLGNGISSILDSFSSPSLFETGSCFLVFNSFPPDCFQNLPLTGLDISLQQYSRLNDTVLDRDGTSYSLLPRNIESFYTIPWVKAPIHRQ